MPRLSADSILYWARQRLADYGICSADADTTVRHLLEADWRGYPGHGCSRLLQIRDGLEKRTLSPSVDLVNVRATPAAEIWDAKYGLGPPAANRAIDRAIQLSRVSGVSVVGVRCGGHIGILAPYVESAARAGCLAVAFTISSPAAVIAGGSRPLLGTNPLAYAWPMAGGLISADFSTSVVSRSRLLAAIAAEEAIPHGWAVDSKGESTEDPAAALQGGLRVLDGGIKGTLISLLLSVIAGPMIGGVANEMVTGTRNTDDPPTKGDVFLCFDIASLTELSSFSSKIGRFLEIACGSSPCFYCPGSRSYRLRQAGLDSPVETSTDLFQFLLYGT